MNDWEAARQAGIIDEAATELNAVANASLVVVCTPVDRLAADVIAVAHRLGPDGIVTDVGSIKAAIVQHVAASDVASKFVPSHPLAGSEKSGWEAASSDLFVNRLCVLTPFEGCDADRLERTDAFWRAIGMQTAQLSPREHDRRLALTSHLPHVVASALASLVGEEEAPLTATGFRDTTRIAAGDPAIWTPILTSNADHVLMALERLDGSLGMLRAALAARDEESVTHWLETARQRRRELD